VIDLRELSGRVGRCESLRHPAARTRRPVSGLPPCEGIRQDQQEPGYQRGCQQPGQAHDDHTDSGVPPGLHQLRSGKHHARARADGGHARNHLGCGHAVRLPDRLQRPSSCRLGDDVGGEDSQVRVGP
jgi:hypothetical protein